uniref:Uncharacterized protein n=1 Tax=Anguilla anguilla TaxID=7936 RepID=A0A0E9ULW1_ANGAN
MLHAKNKGINTTVRSINIWTLAKLLLF